MSSGHSVHFSHVLLQSPPYALYISDSPLSKPLVLSDPDTLALKNLQWLPIVYRMEDRLSLILKDLYHLASIISTETELLFTVHTYPVLSCLHGFTKLFLLLEIPFSFLLPYLYTSKFDLGQMTYFL